MLSLTLSTRSAFSVTLLDLQRIVTNSLFIFYRLLYFYSICQYSYAIFCKDRRDVPQDQAMSQNHHLHTDFQASLLQVR